MRLLCLLLLVCLLLALPVAAVSVNPASLPAIAKVTLTPESAATRLPLKTVLPTTTAMPVQVPLTISSVPAGATVIVNGWASDKITPVTIYLNPGPQTIGLSLDGYRDYSTAVTLLEGHSAVINAPLVRNMTVSRQDAAAAKTFGKPPVITLFTTPVTSTTVGNYDSCTSDQKCLTPAEAAAMFPQGGYWNYNAICGYAGADGRSVPKYCYGAPAGEGVHAGSDPAGILAPVGGQAVHAGNVTNISVQGEQLPVGPRVLGAKRQFGVYESVIGFFSGLFSNPSCPQGKAYCDGGCVDLMTDSSHCGRCDYFCFEPGVCQAGECVDGTPPWMHAGTDILS